MSRPLAAGVPGRRPPAGFRPRREVSRWLTSRSASEAARSATTSGGGSTGARRCSFARARDAETFRRQVEHDQVLGLQVDPSRGAVTFGAYAEEWRRGRRRADGPPRPSDRRAVPLPARPLPPARSGHPAAALHPHRARPRHAAGVCEQASPLQAAKAYRLLRVILNTAVEDERITHNPCKLRGAGVERSPERPFVDADLVLALAVHLDRYVCPDGDALLFTGPRSSELRRATFYTEWDRARKAVGLDHVHLHDLRHAAGTLAAQTGATTRELMARLGHATPAASHRYQHAATRRDAHIAAALDDMVDRASAASLPLMRGGCGAGALETPARSPA